jgi:hypothetical protein
MGDVQRQIQTAPSDHIRRCRLEAKLSPTMTLPDDCSESRDAYHRRIAFIVCRVRLPF